MYRVVICMIMAVIFYPPRAAEAISPSSVEKERVQQWVTQKLSPQEQRLPYSFSVDGISVTPMSWTYSQSAVSLEDGSQRYVFTGTDPKLHLEVRYTMTHYPDDAAVELLLEIANVGLERSGLLEGIRPLDLLYPLSAGRCTLHRALGDLNSEQSFAPVEEEIAVGAANGKTVAPTGGRSSDEQMPYFNVQTETGGLVMAIGWPGQWEAQFIREQPESLCLQAGQQTTHLKLDPGERIRTPRILLQFWEGDSALRGNNLFRQWMLAHATPYRNGQRVCSPLCGTVGYTDPDGSYEGPHVQVMKPYGRLGFEVFWSDMDPQQWYPIGFPEGTGTWEPDPAKYPRGLAPIGAAAHSEGLKYLLWFEPERVMRGTRIDQLHSDWVTYPENDAKGSGLFKFHIPEARAWLTDYIDKQICEAGVDWLRWDFNMRPLNRWQQLDDPDRQGITEIRHSEGLYAMWEELIRRHPGLVVDLCASGGRRLDFETLRYGIPLWHSDRQCFGPQAEADQLQNGGLFRWIPEHGCGNFGLEPSYLFRSGMTTGNLLVGFDPKAVIAGTDPALEESIRKTTGLYKKVRPLMQGDFYPLFAHSNAANAWYGYQFHRADLESGFALVFRRADCEATTEIALRGILAEGNEPFELSYEDTPETKVVAASDMGRIRVEVGTAPGSAIIYYKKQNP